jgi:hypothetical protein
MVKLHKEGSVWGILFVILVALTFIALGPVALILSLNILFPALAIPFTFKTWLATFFIISFFGNNQQVKLKGNK